ncbi:MAG: ROK family protein [Gammaproteobacteria bacterium]
MHQFIGIEGGGTKFVCAYGSGPDDLHDRTVIKTGKPEETIPEIFEYIRSVLKKVDIKAIGISVFGPLDLNKASKTYGYILPTAKVEWSNFDMVGAFQREFNLPIGFDTDVNGAAIGEYRWGAAQGLSDFIYLTIGTGIGGGAMINNKLLHGAQHPEMGHIMIYQDKTVDPFEGVCSHHKNCLEGLASGPSMKVRWNVNSALDLPEDHPAWDIEAHYLGIALATYTMTLCPHRIIMGGGVMRQAHLLPKVRKEMLKVLNGYILNETVATHTDQYVIGPGLVENSGILGAIALAEHSYTPHMAEGAIL